MTQARVVQAAAQVVHDQVPADAGVARVAHLAIHVQRSVGEGGGGGGGARRAVLVVSA